MLIKQDLTANIAEQILATKTLARGVSYWMKTCSR